MRAILFVCLFAGCLQGNSAEIGYEPEPDYAAFPSGCGAPDLEVDRSVETITIAATGAFTLHIPVPVSEATTFDQWLNVTEGMAKVTENGAVIRVTGNGNTTWCHLYVAEDRCCAEKYLDAEWSSDGFWLEVIEGEVTYKYEAKSNYCGGRATLDGPTVGWHHGNDWIVSWCT